MALTLEGTLEIPMEEFYRWVFNTYGPAGMITVYGPPHFNKITNSLVMSVALGDVTSPDSWATKPKAISDWSENTTTIPNY